MRLTGLAPIAAGALATALGGAAAALAQAGATLPIRPGYYADASESCAQAMRSKGGVLVNKRGFEFVDVAIGVAKATRRPNGDYAVVERAAGNGGEGAVSTTSVVRIISPASFSRTLKYEDGTVATLTFKYCAPAAPQPFEQ